MEKQIRSFDDLEVYQRSYRISLEIHRESLVFPSVEQYGLADQIRRASKSVCANIAEGFGKRTYSSAEFKRYLKMSIGSCEEMRVWVQYCIDLGYVSEANGRRWQAEYREIIKMLHGLIKNWR